MGRLPKTRVLLERLEAEGLIAPGWQARDVDGYLVELLESWLSSVRRA